MITAEVKDGKLILIVDVSGEPYRSKSSLEKAAQKGIPLDQVPANAIATSGGFVRIGRFKYAVNVNLA